MEEEDSVSLESARAGTLASGQAVHFTVASSGLSESPPVTILVVKSISGSSDREAS